MVRSDKVIIITVLFIIKAEVIIEIITLYISIIPA